MEEKPTKHTEENHQISNGSSRNIIFDKYEMGRLLGQGTFAKVYHGRNLRTSESVAIKVINKDPVKKEGLMEQITREISVMRMVRHPNVVEIKEVMATKQKIYFVMEYIKGGELFAKIAKGRLKEDAARQYFQQLISAVDFCHSRGVSHRDLKPENLLLDENENLKVSDFGLSALPEHHRNDGLLHTQCGTPAYVAPEVLRKKGYDGAKSDIWSCGVILYVLLAGFLPFQDENLMKMYSKVFKSEFEFPPWFSYDAKRLISRLLVADPQKRITIPGIMKNPWFCKGFNRPIAFSIQEPANETPLDQEDEAQKKELELKRTKSSPAFYNAFAFISSMSSGFDLSNLFENRTRSGTLFTSKCSQKKELELKRTKSSPAFYNAFAFISSMSSGFDLSNLFENRTRSGTLFTSKCSASAIMSKLESLAKKTNFRMVFNKDFKVRMQGASEGRKGKLSVTAEVFEVAPEVAVVEFSKEAGDTLEYRKFCEEDVRPALKDIVWSWQGENSVSGTEM